jgi:hypothetical protein
MLVCGGLRFFKWELSFTEKNYPHRLYSSCCFLFAGGPKSALQLFAGHGKGCTAMTRSIGDADKVDACVCVCVCVRTRSVILSFPAARTLVPLAHLARLIPTLAALVLTSVSLALQHPRRTIVNPPSDILMRRRLGALSRTRNFLTSDCQFQSLHGVVFPIHYIRTIFVHAHLA